MKDARDYTKDDDEAKLTEARDIAAWRKVKANKPPSPDESISDLQGNLLELANALRFCKTMTDDGIWTMIDGIANGSIDPECEILLDALMQYRRDVVIRESADQAMVATILGKQDLRGTVRFTGQRFDEPLLTYALDVISRGILGRIKYDLVSVRRQPVAYDPVRTTEAFFLAHHKD